MIVSTRSTKSGVEILPKFIMKKSKDLMVRGRDFYAIWDEDRKMWSTDEDDVTRLIDKELDRYVNENADKLEGSPIIKYMWDSDSGSIDKWHKYCQKQMRDNYSMLDEELIFSNTELTREKHASKKLPYPLEPGDISAWDKIIGTLYSEEERHKIEWAIGSIVSGDSKHIQKFMVLYGAAGTGKSTILNIVQQLFDGYYATFDAKALGNPSNAFALESFKTNPLVAIQHDGDLSKIEDNTRLNSLVSHELMSVNEKFKGLYETRFKCFLFMGTNRPVKITDGKSGLLRRLIDVHPSGNKLAAKEYRNLMKQVEFELGAIASHCLQVYEDDPEYYDDYIPKTMLGASNDFYNFVCDSFSVFKKENGTTLKAAWEMYKNYCEEANVPFPFSKRNFKEELKNYFWDYDERIEKEDGTKLLSYYSEFKTDIFESDIGGKKKEKKKEKQESWLEFKEQESIFDTECSDCPAQYATSNETPTKPWDEVRTKLSNIDTSRLHYVKIPENHIVIDFDIKDDEGNKSFEKNIEAASKWPATYAELSKSGGGIHLHYIYNGDVEKLSRIYDEDIEVKVFTGKTSLRRKLTKCVNLEIAIISSGLPLKGEKTMINFDGIKNEKYLRSVLKKHINKEIMINTKPSIDMIKKCLDEAYDSGIGYDVSDMKNAIFALAASSSNQADYCLKLVNQMKFKSEEPSVTNDESNTDDLVFYDVEVFPNLFLVNYKIAGEGKPVVRLINPKPSEIEQLMKFKLVGFNCRRYDNHMLYARLMGYTNEQIYNLSQKIINSKKGTKGVFFGEAYNISYTDIYDFASAGNKKSLKKLEIEMGIHHQELGLPWDEPVPEELWVKVAEYCDNDVIATEAAFHYLSADWTARQILADLAGMTYNDTTNSLTTRIIFGTNRKPQNEFNYRNLAEPVFDMDDETYDFLSNACPKMMEKTHGEAGSLLPYFPGYKYENGKSTYRGKEVGEGGFVDAIHGMFGNVALLDVSSMHPHSTIAECLFGVRFTTAFREIVEGRVDIKHEAWDVVDTILGGILKPYVKKVIDGEMTSKQLANALKTAINSVYGLTSASFDNPFRDIRNKDNIVAKRGALFMIDLQHAVQEKGFTVAHIKTDSIKIPDATPEIIQFVMDFGERYGYTFEHEATYDRMCLVNNAVYIAKYKDAEECRKLYGYIPGDNAKEGNKWTATGKQFAVPYVFKTLFSKEPIVLEDMCETFSVKSALYLDMNEKLPDVSGYEKELDKLETKYKQGKLSDTTFESESSRLHDLIKEGHQYQFIGKVGQFCPIKPGKGGGLLMREQNGKYYAATGTTGYRWLESEMMMTPGNDENIDRSYYTKLVDEALETISEYGDSEWFVSNDPYIPKLNYDALPDFMNIPEDTPDELPFL